MNYMKQTAEMLGVKFGEEFKIKDSEYGKLHEGTFCLTKNGMFMIDCKTDFNGVIGSILTGKYKIVKLQKSATPILTDKEKEFLANVIKPFRNRINYIVKYTPYLHEDEGEEIEIVYDDTSEIILPVFETGTMYKGMEPRREYLIEELGL